MSIDCVLLGEDQQPELSRIAQARSLPTGNVFRARLILMLAEGASFSTIKQRLGTTAPTINRWKQRFLTSGIDGLDRSHPGLLASVLTPKRCEPGFSRLPARSLLVAVGMRSALSSSRSVSMHFLALTRYFLFFGFSFSAVKFLEEFRVSRALYNARVLDCPKHPDRRDG